MNHDEALDLLQEALRAVVPDAELGGLPGSTDLRDTFVLDSLDFVEIVERLSVGAGIRIEEDEDLRTIDAIIDLLTGGQSA
ncbi:hypothetical protein [Aeromicrobium sp.]